MSSTPALRRWLAIVGTGAVLALVVGVIWWQTSGKGPIPDPLAGKLSAEEKDKTRAWPLFGGSVQRNLVNLVEKDIARDWDMTPKAEKNIKWSAFLGSKAY